MIKKTLNTLIFVLFIISAFSTYANEDNCSYVNHSVNSFGASDRGSQFLCNEPGFLASPLCQNFLKSQGKKGKKRKGTKAISNRE